MAKKYVITITRQFGSLGRPIAKRMAELLGIEYYDRYIVEKASEHLGMSISYVSGVEERAGTSFFNMQYPLGMSTTDKQDRIFNVESKIINEIADRESCIIVGRCADYILQNFENALHIYIYAPYGRRFDNCVHTLGMDEKTAERMITSVDKARRAYHKKYTGFAPEDIQQKSIMIDSSILGVEKTAMYLVELVKSKFELE